MSLLAGLALGATLLGGLKEKKQKKAQAKDLKKRGWAVNAAYAEKAESVRRRSRRVTGEMMQGLAGRNVAFDGSVGAFINTSLYETELDVANTLLEGSMAGRDLQIQSHYASKEANNILLSTAANVAGTAAMHFGGD